MKHRQKEKMKVVDAAALLPTEKDELYQYLSFPKLVNHDKLGRE